MKVARRTKLDFKRPFDMGKINGEHDIFHVDSDSDDDNKSMTSEDGEDKEVNSKFITYLIHAIRQKLDDESKNSVDIIFTKLIKKINYYEWIYKLMKADEIRIMINNKMDNFKEENQYIPINEFTIRKQVLMNNSEILKSIIRSEFDLNNKDDELDETMDYEGDDEDDDGDDGEDDDGEDDEYDDGDTEPINSQNGSGWLRKRARLYKRNQNGGFLASLITPKNFKRWKFSQL